MAAGDYSYASAAAVGARETRQMTERGSSVVRTALRTATAEGHTEIAELLRQYD